MSLVLVHRDRWYLEKGLVLPSDTDPPGSVSDLTVVSWDGYPPTTVTLSWTIPADLPSGDPVTYEVRAHPTNDGDEGDWPGWDQATIVAIEQAYSGGAGATETPTLAIWNPAPKNGFLFAVKSVDADNNLSAQSNIAAKYEWHTGYSLPLVMYGG